MTHAALQSRLADEIRADVLARFTPGDRLVEVDLADRYGAPRAAVRSALITLSAEGLVERQPHRGARVRSLAIEEGIEIVLIRRELEGICARHAASASTAAERGELLGIVEAMRIALDDDASSRDEYSALSVRLHERIAEVSRHATAQKILREMQNHRLERHFPTVFGHDPVGHSLRQHTAIAQAVAGGDAEAAEQLMREHVGRLAAMLAAHGGVAEPAALSRPD